MAPPIVRFPFDRSGKNRNNFVPGEVHLLDTKQRRLIVPKYGAFFGQSVILVDNYTKKKLDHGTQYAFESVRPSAVSKTGKGVYGVIVVTDPSVSASVSLSYQVVGGQYQNHTEDAMYLAEVLSTDNRPPTAANLSDMPDEFPPSLHFQDIRDFYNFDRPTHDVERIRMLNGVSQRLNADAIWAYTDAALTDLSKDGADAMTALMTAHKADPAAHPQYVLKSEIGKYILPIRQPINMVPQSGKVDVDLDVTLTASAYLSLYRVLEDSVQFQVSLTSDFSDIPAFDVSVAGSNYHYTDILLSNKLYYWRCRYKDVNGDFSPWSVPTPFTTIAVSVAQPVFISPTSGASTNTEIPTLIGSAFSISGATDSHAASDWEVWTGPNGTGTRIWSKVGDTVNKTSIVMPLAVLTRQETYYPRVRYKATKYGYSPWSTGASFYATWPLRPTVIGQAFGGGFWGGDITIGTNTYAIIVAPKASGEKTLKLVGNLVVTPQAASAIDSVANTTALFALAGTSASAAAAWVKALNIANYTDWQIPSLNALAVVEANLLPGGASTPAPFKTGGAEAFTATYYWTSTTSDYTVTTQYTEGGDPIYDTRTTTKEQSRSLSSGPIGESAGGNVARNVKCSASEDGPNNVDGPNFVQSGNGNVNGDPIGYFYASWTCTVTTTKTVIVGYTPVEYYSYDTNYYRAYAQSMSSAANTRYDKTGSYPTRAVRLVLVKSA